MIPNAVARIDEAGAISGHRFKLKRAEGVDVYDRETEVTPFSVKS